VSASTQTARCSGWLSQPDGAMLYRVHLQAGDLVTTRVDTSPYGGGFDSFLRVFQDVGGTVNQIASNDNNLGLDAGVTFQASTAGDYIIGVSSFDNIRYDVTQAQSGIGSSQGLFDLSLSKSSTAPAPALTVSSFDVSQDTGLWGETFTVQY